MCVQAGCNSNSSIATVTIANKKTFVISGCNSNYTYSSVFFPIRKSQSINCSTSSLTSNSSYFIKSKADKIVILPDWKNSKLRQWCEEYTADCDGWIYADTGSTSNTGYVRINNNLQMFICRQDNGRQSYSSVLVPLSSGDKYYFYHASFPGVCYFIPGRKDHQIGMPDWDKEENKTWETNYQASEKGWVYAQCQCYYCQNTSKECTPGYLMVNGVPIIITQNNSSYYDNASVFIPVAKGDTFNACGGHSNKSISFFPCLK